MSNFVHLRVRTEYSIQDSIVRVKPLMQTIIDHQMNAVGISDFCNFFAVVKSYQAAVSKGIKPLIGVDLPCCFAESPEEVTLLPILCQTMQGYHQATRLISRAYLEGQIRGAPRVHYEWLVGNTTGLIALSGAVQGLIGQALLKGDQQKAKQFARLLQDWFPDRFYLEIQRIGLPTEDETNVHLVALADMLQLPLVATNEVRFLTKNEYDAHQARVCIHDGCTLSDSRSASRYTHQQYFRCGDEMQRLFADLPQALENTIEIAKRCTLRLTMGNSFLPKFPVPEALSEDDYLVKLSRLGLENRLKSLPATKVESDYQERLETELMVIQRMGFAGYFLIVADFIGWSKSQGIRVGPGRGSGAGSLVAYALNITDLDPLSYDLLFERFLNPERVSMPDFDIDFCMEGRDRVIEYVTEKYGRLSVSQIITFGSMAAKAVVRDVGRVLSHPYGFVDKLAKLIPFELGITLQKALADNLELRQRYETEEEVKELLDLALSLEGLIRNPGKHAGGVVIAPSALTDFTAIYCESDSAQLVSQFDKDDVESVGLVKFDFLGLRTLTIIDWALAAINQARMEERLEPIQIELIPLDCPQTFDLLRACHTSAVFQLESRGMKELIHRLQPDSFEEIIALVALFRPGPLQSGMVDDFINRKHGRAKVVYPHPDLEPILKPTYGVILYQEQVMQIAQVLANYTLGAADLLRRAMGKKKPEEMAKQRAIFLAGARERGIEDSVAGHIFDLMEKFAGYGFNKSHSAAYALISYQTAWLKARYPAAFMAAVLSSDMDNTDKVVFMIEECKHMHLSMLPPSIEQSDFRFTVANEQAIRYGLGAIKGVGEAVIELIVQARKQEGRFNGLFDFCFRMDLRKLNRRVMEALIKSGAMDEWEQPRSVLLASLDKAIQLASVLHHNQQIGQLDLFSQQGVPESSYVAEPNWLIQKKLAFEKEVLGFYFSGHPTTQYHQHEFKDKVSALEKLDPTRFKKATICVLVLGIRTVTTKRGKSLQIVTVEDHSAKLEVVLFGEVFERFKPILVIGQVIFMEGEIAKDHFNGKSKVVVQSCYSLSDARNKLAKSLHLHFSQEDQIHLAAVQTLLSQYQGALPVEMSYQNHQLIACLRPGAAWKVSLTDDLLNQLTALLGEDRVKLVYS